MTEKFDDLANWFEGKSRVLVALFDACQVSWRDRRLGCEAHRILSVAKKSLHFELPLQSYTWIVQSAKA
jgi:hypothetical protein